MGNGQNRRRRGGAHTRNGPHRGSASASDRRSATHVMPPTLADDASAEASEASDESQASASIEEARADTNQGAVSAGEPEQSAPAAPLASEVSEASEASEPDDASEAAPAPEEVAAEPEVVAEAEEPEQRAPRGRFERFYAPGQQKRPASNGQHGAPERNGAVNGGGENNGADAAHGHPTTPTHAPEAARPHASHAPHADDEDGDEETPIASGPRADVRGAVGDLIDSLHEIFARDRAIASQGGISRCGICYLHYPLGELVYHESEGFYVCQTCERALGGARVNMVRRQQRQ